MLPLAACACAERREGEKATCSRGGRGRGSEEKCMVSAIADHRFGSIGDLEALCTSQLQVVSNEFKSMVSYDTIAKHTYTVDEAASVPETDSQFSPVVLHFSWLYTGHQYGPRGVDQSHGRLLFRAFHLRSLAGDRF